MYENEKTNCQKCGIKISYEDQYILNDVLLYDDCYMEENNHVNACKSLECLFG